LSPQAQTVPSERSARLWPEPAATLITPVSPVTLTGTLLLVRVPLPSSPAEFAPHAQTLPSEVSASEWLEPAETCTTPLPSPLACWNSALLAVVPVPSWPSWLLPQLTAPVWVSGGRMA
jgi:hypothetical protein